jgi:hypothetical protein
MTQLYRHIIRSTGRSLHAGHVMGLTLIVVTLTGCFTARIGTGATSANRQDTTIAVVSYLWGTVMDNKVIQNDSLNTFSDIEITQDFGQVTVSLLTLGLYIPMTAHCYVEKCRVRDDD